MVSEAQEVKLSSFSDEIFKQKYSMNGLESWPDTAHRVATEVTKDLIHESLTAEIKNEITSKRFIPAGRYLYAAGRPWHAVNNCYLLRAADSREGWAELSKAATSSLMSGGGIGVNYSDVRPEGALIHKTGGLATGPIALMNIINETGRNVMQGGSRRCLPWYTLVTMQDGSRKQIQDVQVGDIVATRFGGRKVLNIFDQGVQPVIEIRTEYGTVVSTKNHKWLSADRTRRKMWMTAGDLSLNNKLYFHPFRKGPEGNEDTRFAYVLGFFVGNGCARTAEVTFQVADKHKTEEQLKLIEEVMQEQGAQNPTRRQGHGRCTEIRCRGKNLVATWQKFKTPHCPQTWR